MLEELKSALGEDWSIVLGIVLGAMSPHKDWVISQEGDGPAYLLLGKNLAPIAFRDLSQASTVQGLLTLAKIAFDRETVRPN